MTDSHSGPPSQSVASKIRADLRERRAAIVEVNYPKSRGTIGLRGSEAPLSWEETMMPTREDGDRKLFVLDVPEDGLVELKLVRNDEDWSAGRNYMLHAGEHLHIDAYFDAAESTILDEQTVDHNGMKISYRVLLPPSYAEQDHKRYPVLFAMDGQSLWTFSEDPFGVWNLDETLNELFELAAIDEMIVVAINHSEDRAHRLSPFEDSESGGGGAAKELSALVEAILPQVRERFRTKEDSDNTAIMGSSMGGLFAFYAAWMRPDVFGKAACLSSSFWWANRQMVREVQTKGPITDGKHAVFYLDTGASKDPLDTDAGARDGFHHTRSMARALMSHGFTPGRDLHRFAFTGQGHEAAAWGARIGTPLQLLFPPAASTMVPRDDLPPSENPTA